MKEDKEPHPEEQGARSRNAVPSEARDVPLAVAIEGAFGTEELAVFYVSKVQLRDGLIFIAEGRDAEQRQARARHIFSNLIARSRK